MKINVHRGTHRIGGTVTGIETEKTRIIVDFGNPPFETESLKPFDGVVFTHYHGDHTGQIGQIPEGIPAYIGKASKAILALSKTVKELKTYENEKPFFIGDIKITPVLTDHSAFDAYMLLIEGDGQRILHTGDFRLHGIRGGGVIPALEKYRGQIDVMILECTNSSYRSPVTVSEAVLGRASEVLMARYPYIFILCSAENIDRLAVFHEASRGKKAFYCDEFQMSVFDAAKRFGQNLSGIYGFERAEIYKEENLLQNPPESFSMVVSENSSFQKITADYAARHREKSLFIFSMPEAYLRKHKAEIEALAGNFPYKIKLHTSGHASEMGLWAAVHAAAPGRIIPIHTENPKGLRLGAYQSRIVFLEDGEDYEVRDEKG